MVSVCCCPRKGVSSKCVRCTCVRKKVPCVSCFPSKSRKCKNSLSCRQKKVLFKPNSPNSELAMRSPLLTGPSTSSLLLNTNLSTITESVGSNESIASDNETAKPCKEKASKEMRDTHGRNYLETVNDISIDTLGNDTNGTQSGRCVSGRCVEPTTRYGRDDVDKLTVRAFGEPLVHSTGEDTANALFQHWKTVVGLQGKQYNLPG